MFPSIGTVDFNDNPEKDDLFEIEVKDKDCEVHTLSCSRVDDVDDVLKVYGKGRKMIAIFQNYIYMKRV